MKPPIALVLLALAFLIGVVGALDWILYDDQLNQAKFTTSLSIMVSSVLVFSLSMTPSQRLFQQKYHSHLLVLGVLLFLFAGLAFLSYLTGTDISLPRLLEEKKIGELYDKYPGPMSAIPATSFTLLAAFTIIHPLWLPKKATQWLSTGFLVALPVTGLNFVNFLATVMENPFLFEPLQTAPTPTAVSAAIFLIGVALLLFLKTVWETFPLESQRKNRPTF